MTTPTKDQLDNLERLEGEVMRINTEARGTVLDSIGMARLNAAHERWGGALKVAATALTQAARERDDIVAFLREHGPDLALYSKPQVEGLKRPCRDALLKMIERFGKRR